MYRASFTIFITTNKFTINITTVYNTTVSLYTGRFVMLSVITNIYNKKTKGPTLMKMFTATEKLKKFFFDN